MRRKVKVIHIITRMTIGGSQENTLITVSNLNKERFDAIVLSGEEKYDEGNFLDEVESQEIPYFTNRFLVRPINQLKDFLCLLTMIKFIKQQKGKIIHTHGSKAGIIGRIAGFLAGSKIIIHTAHGWIFHDSMSKWKRSVYVFFERLAGKFSDAIICVTNQDVLKGLRYNVAEKRKYHIIRSGFDVNRFRNAAIDSNKVKQEHELPSERKIVGTVGRLSHQKDHETLIKVANVVCRQRDDVIFTIVGDGELRPKIEGMINEMKLNEKVFLLGAQKKIEKLFAIFDVFLLTSLWEGLPKVIPQAMASGVPVVSTAVDGVKEVVKDGINGFLCVPMDVESLAAKVIHLLDNKDLRSRFVNNSSQVVHQFDAVLMVKKIEDLYYQLIKQFL